MTATQVFADILSSLRELGNSLLANAATVELAVTALILIVGFGLARLASRIILRVTRRGKPKSGLEAGNESLARVVRYTIMSIAILAALIYLQTASVEGIASLYGQLPGLLSLVLLLLLGISLIQVLIQLLESLLHRIGLIEYLEMYNRSYLVEPVMMGLRIVLYLFLLELALAYIGIKFTPASTLMVVALYIALVALGLLVVLGMRNQAENFFASIYLHSLEHFKVGHKITFAGKTGTIKDTTSLHTEIELDSKEVMLVPNRTLVNEELIFEKKYPEFDTLEDIKRYYVAQKPSHCGPAAAEIVLKILGYEGHTQEDIGKMCDTKVGLGTHPDVLIDAITKLTKNQVKGAWVSFEYITALGEELEGWLDQGALVIVDFKKDFLFPKHPNRAHYAVCLGVKDDELLILDPSAKTGGVYLVSASKIERGMNTYSKLIKGKRGYIVLAPEGTKAYWRLENGLLYSDLGLYEGLSKTLEHQFIDLLKKKRFKSLMPKAVKRFLKNWEKSEDTIYRLWHPDDEKVKIKKKD